MFSLKYVYCVCVSKNTGFFYQYVLEYQDFYNSKISKFDYWDFNYILIEIFNYRDIFTVPSHTYDQGLAI